MSGIGGYAAALVPAHLFGIANSSNTHFVDVGLAGSTLFFKQLEHAETYFGVVSVWDRVGNERKCYSDGVFYDDTPPDTTNATLLSHLALNEYNLQRVAHLVHAEVLGIVDPETGVRQYYAAIGPLETATFRSIGTSEGVMLIGALDMADGEQLVTVRAVNNAKESSEVSITIGVDTTPPICQPIAIWHHPPGFGFQYTEETSRLEATFNCTDAPPWEQMPLNCTWAVGTYVNGDDVMAWRYADWPLGGVHVFECAECLQNGFVYFVTLRCVDQVELSTMVYSGGLMPDLIGPMTVADAVVVSRVTGIATEFWGFANELRLQWGFDDFESGVKSIRCAFLEDETSPVSGLRDVAGYRTMPYVMPVGPDQRDATISLASQGIQLKHNRRYFIHVCAEDHMDHLACSPPWNFLVDLTPPVCTGPFDLIAGLSAPAFFSQRHGYASEWHCDDPESGVVTSKWMAYADGEPLLASYFIIAEGSGSAKVTIPEYVDGKRFYSCVYSTNYAELYNVENTCSPGTVYDDTPPVFLGSMFDEADGGFRDTSPWLCTGLLAPEPSAADAAAGNASASQPIYDPTSGVARVELELMEQIGNDFAFVGEPLVIDDLQSRTWPAQVCRNASLEHGKRYMSRLLMYNGAAPSLVSQSRALGFRTDDTPPKDTGTVAVRFIFPRKFATQPNFPMLVSNLRFRVRLSGFEDDESGIAQYKIVVKVEWPSSKVYYVHGHTESELLDTEALPHAVPNSSVVTAEVYAFNRVGLAGPVIVSPARVLILGPINLDDPWFADGDDGQQVGALPSTDDAGQHILALQEFSSNVGFNLATDPMNSLAFFDYAWAITRAPCDDEEPPTLTEWVHVEQGWLMHPHYQRPQLPSPSASSPMRPYSNDMLVPRPGAAYTARNAVWSVSSKAFGLDSGKYCALVSACTLPTYGEDGLLHASGRCVNATSLPALLDLTRPEAWSGVLRRQNASGGSLWPMEAGFACEDRESGIRHILLSIGRSDHPTEFIDSLRLNVSTGPNGTVVAIPALNVSGFEGVQLMEVNGTAYISGALVVSRDLFIGLEQASLTATVVCFNALNMEMSASTMSKVNLKPAQAPNVSFDELLWVPTHQAWVGTLEDAQRVTARWSGTAGLVYSVCVTMDQRRQCQVESHDVGSAVECELLKIASYALLSNRSSSTFSVEVTATDSLGQESSSDALVMIDHTIPWIGNLSLGAFAADSLAAVAGNGTSALSDTVVRVELVGGALDPDLEVPLAVQWTQHANSNTVACTYSRLEPSWVWAAQCNVTEVSELCFGVSAVSVINLSSVERTACVAVDVMSSPTWTSTPVLTRTANEQDGLNATWAVPHNAFGHPFRYVHWALCTHAGCNPPTASYLGQTSVLISLHDELLLGYGGATWVIVQASMQPTAASIGQQRAISSRTSNTVVVGATEPTPGRLVLSPRRMASLEEGMLLVGGFVEPVFSISSFVWCVGTRVSSADLVPCRTEAELPSRISFSSLPLSVRAGWVTENATRTVVVTATACNERGQCASAVSNIVMVDKTPPSAGYLADGLLVEDEATWADVLVLKCDELNRCAASPLLPPGGAELSASQVETKVGPLRKHMLAETNTVQLRRFTDLLSASWGGFHDNSSGIGEVVLCFGRADGPLSGHSCAAVGPSGLAIYERALSEHVAYVATLSVANQGGLAVTVESPGMYSLPTPANISTELTVSGRVEALSTYQLSCNELRVAWSPVTEPGCPVAPEYAWQLCDARGKCTEDRILPNGTHAVRLDAANLEPGVSYYSRTRVLARCSGATSTAVTGSLLCDESDPEVVGSPRLEMTDGSLAVSLESTSGVLVRWAGAFHEEESLITKAEVCLTYGSSKCPGEWYDAGTNVTAELPLPLLVNHTVEIRAVVRVATIANGTAVATSSASLLVDHAPPKVWHVSVDGFLRGLTERCVLNRTEQLVVTWKSFDQSAHGFVASGLAYHMVSATLLDTMTPMVVTETGNSAVDNELLVPNVSVADGSMVRFTVHAFDGANLNGSDYLDCLISEQTAPAAPRMWINNATMLRRRVYTVDSSKVAPRQVCWGGLDSSSALVDHYLFWSQPLDTVEASMPRTVPSTTSCVEDTTSLVEMDGAYALRVAAVNAAGMQGAAAEVIMIPDGSPPVASGPVRVHTGGLSKYHQSSPCCLRLSWNGWVEEENYVTGYQLCHKLPTNRVSCLDVGNATRVVVTAPMRAACSCAAPADASQESHYSYFEHSVANVTSLGTMLFTLHASNVLGLTGESNPLTIRVDTQPPDPPQITFAGRSRMTSVNRTGACAPSTNATVLHPAGMPLELTWTPEEKEDLKSDVEVLPLYEMCLDSACTNFSSAEGIGSFTSGRTTPGLHNFSVRKVSVAGLWSPPTTWLLMADQSPPVLGDVRALDLNPCPAMPEP